MGNEAEANPFDGAPVKATAAPAATPYADAAQAIEDPFAGAPFPKSKLEDVYSQVSLEDPDRAAKVLRLASHLDRSPEEVQANLPAAQASANAPAKSLLDDIDRNYPKTRDFVSAPKSMAVVRDDLGNLRDHEELVGQVVKSHTLLDELIAGYQSGVTDQLARKGQPLSPVALALTKLQRREMPGDEQGFWHKQVAAAGALASDFPAMVAGSLAGSVAGGGAGASAGTVALPVVGTVGLGTVGAVVGGGAGAFALPTAIKATLREYGNGDVKSSTDFWNRVLGKLVHSGMDAGAYGTLDETAKSALIGGLTGPAGALGGKAAAPAVERLMLRNGVARVGLSGAISRTAGKALDVGARVGTESVAMEEGSAATEGREPTIEGALSNVILMAGVHGAHAAADHVGDMLGLQKTVDAQAFYKALGDTAEASKLRERLPDEYQKHIAKLTENGPVENVFIPADRFAEYFQGKGLDPKAVASELGADASFDEAQKTGAPVQIPLSQWATKVAPTEHFQALAPDIKFDADSMTPRELQAHAEERQASMKQQMAELDAKVKEQENPGTANEGASKVQADVEAQLLHPKVGMGKAEAEANAKLWGARFRTLGEQTGRDPWEVYQEHRLTVARQEGPDAVNEKMFAQTPAAIPDPLNGKTTDEFLRERQAARTPEEQVKRHFLDPVTHTLNERAFNAMPVPEGKQVAHVSVEGVKFANGLVKGHSAGDDLYRYMGQALKEVAPEVAKVSGDFALHVKDKAELESILKKAREALPEKMDLGGKTVESKGFTLSGGVGKDLAEAGKVHGEAKKGAVERGERAERGEKPLGFKEAEGKAEKAGRKEAEISPALRQEFAKLSPEEAYKASHIDPKSGMLTYEAFKDLPEKAARSSVDLDGLKVLNDNYGTESGDELLRHFEAVAQHVAKRRGIDVDLTHKSGDEYLSQHNDINALHNYWIDVERKFKDDVITFAGKDGKRYEKVDNTLGVGNGPTDDIAEQQLQLSKDRRKGRRSSSSVLGGVREEGAQRRADDRRVEERRTGVSTGMDAGPADEGHGPGGPDEESGVSTDFGDKSFNQSPSDISPLGYYSQVGREVQKMDFKSIPAKDLLGRIKNLPGIKAEELEWLGLNDWLKAREAGFIVEAEPGKSFGKAFPTEEEAKAYREEIGTGKEFIRQEPKVTKDEVLSFIRNRGVKVEQIVLSKDFGGTRGEGDNLGMGDLDWSEKEQIETDPHGDITRDEAHYYLTESPEDYFPDEWAKFKEENAEAFKAAGDEYSKTSRLAKKFADEASQEVQDKAWEMAEESINDPDSSYARHRITEGASGWSMEGSDDFGWYTTDVPGERGTDLGSNEEEAKIKLVSLMLQHRVIKGDRSELVKEQDIGWGHSKGQTTPSHKTLKKKGKALFKTDPEKYIAAAKEQWGADYWDELKPKEQVAKWNEYGGYVAENEVEESYRDPENAKNKVMLAIDHPALDAHIEGNNKKGWSLAVSDDDGPNKDFPLEAKSVDDAKKEAISVMKDKGFIGGKPKAAEGEPEPDHNTPAGTTRHAMEGRVVPGGKNHRELLLTLPDLPGDKFVQSGHFPQKNIVVFMRVSDRVDAEGKKTLFVEEQQSDWHQQGRKQGYEGESPEEEAVAARHDKLAEEVPVLRERLRANLPMSLLGFETRDSAIEAIRDHADFAERWDIKDPELLQIANDYRAKAAEMAEIEPQVKRRGKRVPDAPFKNTEAYSALGMKRVFRLAVEQGYDAIAFSPAAIHVDRWGTDSVSWVKKDDHWLVGSTGQRGGNVDGMNLEEAARERGLLLERNGEKVASKEELRPILENTLSFDTPKELDAMTESVWKQMQSGDSGVKAPRKEGMEFFYDNVVPKKVVPGILKKLDKDAKVKVGQIAYSDPREGVDEGKMPVWQVDLTDAIKAKTKEGFSLFQQGDEGARGRIRIGGADLRIDLFKNADKSTFLHETGHAFLEILQREAGKEGAPEDLKSDYDATLKYLGAEPGAELTSEQHEKWARSFEAYLMEGKAPSSALKTAFQRFKAWLMGVYQSATHLKVDINDEIRGVMDRMLGSRDEVEAARGEVGLDLPLENVPPEVAKRVQELTSQAREHAEELLLKEQLKEISESQKAEREAKRERLTKEVTDELKTHPDADPVYAAMDSLRRTTKRDPLGVANRFLEDKVTDKEAARMEETAEVHGFSSGEDLARYIIASEANGGFDADVKARVEEKMPKLLEGAELKKEALRVIHDTKTTELLALEREALLGLTDRAVQSVAATKQRREQAMAAAKQVNEEAKRILDAKGMSDATKATPYFTAERNAAVRVQKAMAKKDYEAAAKAKEEQMLSHALAREAMRNRDEAEGLVTFLEKAGHRAGDLKKFSYGFSRQLIDILSRRGLTDAKQEDTGILTQIAQTMSQDGESPADVANATGLRQNTQQAWVPETLSDFVARVNDNYMALQLPASVLSPDGRQVAKLTLPELRDLKDAVKAISTIARTYKKFKSFESQFDIDQAGALFAESVEKEFGHPAADSLRLGSKNKGTIDKALGALKEIPAYFARNLDTALTTVEKLDGGNDGLAKKYIYRPIAEAENRRLERLRDEMTEVDALFGKHYTPEELSKYKDDTVVMNAEGDKVSKYELLSMLLNWGNPEGRDRITRAEGMLPEEMEKKLFENLTKKDFTFAQNVWDYFDKFKPEIKELEMRTNGNEPKWVESSPIKTPWGDYAGGYYPLRYDSDRSATAFRYAEATGAMGQQYGAGRAQTEQGFTKERVATLRRPLRYDLAVLTDHLEDVVKDLTYRDAVIDVSRFLGQKDAKGALLNALGVRGYKAMGDWLKAVASDPSMPTSYLGKAANWFRFKTTFYLMGYRIASMPKIALENMVNVSSELGVARAARAMGEYWFSFGGDVHNMVIGKSEFMRQRAEHLDRDMGEVLDKYKGEQGSAYHRFAFHTHAILDQAVSFPLWSFVYKESLSKGLDENDSVHSADEAVKRTFMAGGTLNQAAVMRGGEFQKAMTVAFGYQSMMWNRYSRAMTEVAQSASAGSYMDAAYIAARAHFYSFIMPAAVIALTQEILHNAAGGRHDKKDMEKRAMEAALHEGTPLKFLPVIRDIIPYALNKILGEHGRDLQVTPLERAVQTLIDPELEMLGRTMKGEKVFDKRSAEQIANQISLLVPVPKQVDDVVFNFLDWQKDHGKLVWQDLLKRRSRK